MDAQKRRVARAGEGDAGFTEPDVRRKLGEGDMFTDCAVFVEDAVSEFVEAETASALPVHCGRDAALLTINDFLKARDTVRDRVLAHFDTYIAAAPLMGDGCCCAGAEEGVEHKIAGIRGDMKNTLEKALRLGRGKNVFSKKGKNFFLRLVGVTGFRIRPKVGWNLSGNIVQISFATNSSFSTFCEK